MALWIGLANGDLFDYVIALSPGGTLPRDRVGRPRVFIAHGRRDRVIPSALGGDRAHALLAESGYRVELRRFRGGHTVRPELVRRAVRQFLAG